MKVEINGFGTLGMALFCGMLAYLKVVHGAAISWMWVFAPVWLPMAIVVGIWLIIAAIALICAAVAD